VPDPKLLTVGEFLGLARNRGKELTVELDREGISRITDGSRSYPLPRLQGGRMPSALVASLCQYFGLPGIDFALDPGREDY
jgi:hypothetical protein